MVREEFLMGTVPSGKAACFAEIGGISPRFCRFHISAAGYFCFIEGDDNV
jgi:hypothetical protein